MTYAALPGNGLPIQRNYGIAPGNERHQPVSTATSCLHIHLPVLPLFSISDIDAGAGADSNEDTGAEAHSNVDADAYSNVGADADSNVDADNDADGAFWAG